MLNKQNDQESLATAYEKSVEPRRKKRDGVVTTPLEVVDFQVRSTIRVLEEQGHQIDNVEWLDPFCGTGIYIARLLQLADLSPSRKAKLAGNCVMTEIDPEAAQLAANNLARVCKEETGKNIFVRVLCVDIFSLPPDVDLWDKSLDCFVKTPVLM